METVGNTRKVGSSETNNEKRTFEELKKTMENSEKREEEEEEQKKEETNVRTSSQSMNNGICVDPENTPFEFGGL